ncbi:hypothetical protein CMT57_08155 [Elizabethkingia anophelis]|nr:hypothetical protein [Elizabethkingia anophelis]MDV3777104.1 hypothetical protein [Elizabethkingia anophelis]MDV3788665.1 hypothetical protein [Elizabethkingia anophelis]MDV3841553.1 hypothetical protein [Elizabethkingia anophelis]MDV3951719.1 hypothetical protein [Elizabethkingia anophelis]
MLDIYHSVSLKHFQKYCDELAFRYNMRDYTEGFKFNLAFDCTIYKIA